MPEVLENVSDDDLFDCLDDEQVVIVVFAMKLIKYLVRKLNVSGYWIWSGWMRKWYLCLFFFSVADETGIIFQKWITNVDDTNVHYSGNE